MTRFILGALSACIVLGLLAFVVAHRVKPPVVQIEQIALKDYPKDHMLFAPCAGGRFAPRQGRNVS